MFAKFVILLFLFMVAVTCSLIFFGWPWSIGLLIAVTLLFGKWLMVLVQRPIDQMVRLLRELAYEGRFPPRTLFAVGMDPRLEESFRALAEAIAATTQQVMQDRTRLSTIFSNMVEGVVAVDPSGSILAVNPTFSTLFSIQAEEAQGKRFLEVLRHSDLNALLREVLKTCERYVTEVVVHSPDERIFEVHALPLLQDGACQGALLVLHDITRLRRLEQVRKDFVANVSHELRTPLASIKGYAETLRSGALEDRENRLDFVLSIEEQAGRLTHLVDDLLTLSAVESGKVGQEKSSIDLQGLVAETVDELGVLAEQRAVTLKTQFPEQLGQVLANRESVRQILVNLIDNAIKFNRESGLVVVSLEQAEETIAVFVQDTGIGIPSVDVPRLFERFYRVDKARPRALGGTGLGLAIVKHLVETQGGQVGVESKENEGTTFYFTLPRA